MTAFQQPKKGLFVVEKKDGKYLKFHYGWGWEKEIREYTIIGEDKVLYYTNTNDSVNKTRLTKWVESQTGVFDNIYLGGINVFHGLKKI